MRTRLSLLAAAIAVAGTLSACASTEPVALALSFRQQPTTVPVNQPIIPAVVVGFVDDSQGQVTTTDAMITVTVTGGPGGATLGGTVSKMSVDGVATFDDLTIDMAGAGYQLLATSEGFNSVTSDAFNVTP
jgi:hypothetical protein